MHSFTGTQQLRRHNCVDGVKWYNCKECQEGYNSAAELEEHNKIVHDLECPHCGKVFETLQHVTRHIQKKH